MKKEKLNCMQKAQRKAEKKANKEGIKLFCNSLKKQMLSANKNGRHFDINMSQYPQTNMNSGEWISFAEGDKIITVMIELK